MSNIIQSFGFREFEVNATDPVYRTTKTVLVSTL